MNHNEQPKKINNVLPFLKKDGKPPMTEDNRAVDTYNGKYYDPFAESSEHNQQNDTDGEYASNLSLPPKLARDTRHGSREPDQELSVDEKSTIRKIVENPKAKKVIATGIGIVAMSTAGIVAYDNYFSPETKTIEQPADKEVDYSAIEALDPSKGVKQIKNAQGLIIDKEANVRDHHAADGSESLVYQTEKSAVINAEKVFEWTGEPDGTWYAILGKDLKSAYPDADVSDDEVVWVSFQKSNVLIIDAE